MVKNKALPDSSRLSAPPSGHSLSLSFSLSPRRLGPIKAGLTSLSLANTIHLEGTPWILPRLDPSNLGLYAIPVRSC